MKKLRWRLFLNFLFQFILVAASMLFVIFFTLMFVVVFFTKDYSEHNYYQAMLESITMDTGNSFSELSMAEDWDKDLEKDNVWVQIVAEDGQVIESGNVPNQIPKSYSQVDLINLKETKEQDGYSLVFYLETFYKSDYLFVLGYEDAANHLLQNIVQDFSEDGVISKPDVPAVEELLIENKGKLVIYDTDETLLQEIGEKHNNGKPLDVFIRDASPDIFSTNQNTYRDPESGTLWVLYTPNESKKELELNQYRDLGFTFAITALIVLFITIIISIWNGFRYGNPLFVFTRFLDRLGNEQYEEVLTPQEKKQIFKRNNKLKLRYRLYKEVFQAFYDMAEKLNHSKKEREQLEKSREEWMAGISHDLRTPLTTMQGYGKLLENDNYEWSKQELIEIGKTIHDKSDYMVRLIEEFTLSFQLKNDATQVVFEQVDVNQLLMNISEKFKRDRTLEEYLITYNPIKEPEFLLVNERLFERMMDNLIYNAIKHNPKGTKIELILEKLDNSNGIKILIKDNGIGIDDVTKKHLFDRYYRGTNTDERTEGAGLGMSIALQIAKLHHGTIHVDSIEDQGTVVTIVLLKI